ncbi:MAG: hypothetical protein KME17_13590 [Cyanosarcina radialis HA8281-LM2]|jgi:hypothetical protein|nr:hypothetical protein [Cyanosarcina radialis HA8281-LM2]
MNNQPRIPDPETRARSVARMREICLMFDAQIVAQIVLLDELIAQGEAENRQNPINIYRREQGKRLLESLKQQTAK